MGCLKSSATAINRVQQLILLAALTISLSACSTLGLKAPWNDEHDADPDYELIADNLVNSLAQFPHLNPMLATVQVVKPSSAFSQRWRTSWKKKASSLSG